MSVNANKLRSMIPAKYVFAAVALLLVASVGIILYRQQHTLVLPDTIADNLDANGELRPLVKFATACKALKLITVTVDSSVTASSEDENWRGTATASVTVPVRYGYGVDLAEVRNSRFSLKPYMHEYTLLIPRPRRITTEVNTGKADSKVDVTGLRFKAMSGQTQALIANSKLYAEAQRQTIPTAEKEAIERQTVEQIEKLVKLIVGDDSSVTVRYED